MGDKERCFSAVVLQTVRQLTNADSEKRLKVKRNSNDDLVVVTGGGSCSMV